MHTSARSHPGSICFGALAAFMMSVTPAHAQVRDRDALLRLNGELLESMFLRQDTSLLASVALSNLIVVPPGGIVENRAEVLAGVRNVAMDSVQIDDVTVVGHELTAIVVARVGRLGPRREPGGTGRSRIMSVFVYDQERWRLLARSVTPCIERAVAAGRC